MFEDIAVYRSMLSVDIERSAGRGDAGLIGSREILATALRLAAETADLDWKGCTVSRHGDLFQLIAPAGTDKARMIDPLVPALARELRLRNRASGPTHQVRVRAVVHAGEVLVDDGEVVGHPFELLARLQDAAPLRDALAAAPAPVTVALLVSEHVYEDTVRQGHRGIDPDTFVPVAVAVKETMATAWLHVPGMVAVAAAASTPADQPGEERDRAVNVARGHARVGQMIGSVGTQVTHADRTSVGWVGGDAAVGPGSRAGGDFLLDGLVGLRRAVQDRLRTGELDEDTYAAAETELAAAGDHAAALGEGGRGKLVLALKRLHGLLSDVSDLGTRVLSLLAAVRAL